MQWSIGHIATKRALVTPDKVAIYYEDVSVTYRELNGRANQLAWFFQAKGMRKGDRIAVDLLNCPDFLAAYLAAAKLGLVFVPLNVRMVGPEIAYQVNDCGARMLLFHDAFLKPVAEAKEKIVVEPDKFVWVKSGNPGCPPCPDWAVDLAAASDQPTGEPSVASPVEMSDPLAIIYTSGVTGSPKGAVLSHEQTFFKNFQIMMYVDMREDDVFLSQLPLFHSGGLFIVATPTLCRGATLVMRQTFQPDQFAKDIERYRATVVFALTTMWKFVLQSKALDTVDVSSVREVLGGGERTPASLLEEMAAKGLRMRLGFGQTENSAMMIQPAADVVRKAGSIGLPGFFTRVWIENARGGEAAPGEVGEMVAAGPTVMSGYWNLPEKTAETIVNGVLRTGDLGYRDEEGYFYIVDRAKDMYRSGGENVYPAEVEKVLADHPTVELVAVIGVRDEKWGETGKAFVVPRKGETVDAEELASFLEGKLARYKHPSHYQFVDALPMTASGKVRKAALKETLLSS